MRGFVSFVFLMIANIVKQTLLVIQLLPIMDSGYKNTIKESTLKDFQGESKRRTKPTLA